MEKHTFLVCTLVCLVCNLNAMNSKGKKKKANTLPKTQMRTLLDRVKGKNSDGLFYNEYENKDAQLKQLRTQAVIDFCDEFLKEDENPDQEEASFQSVKPTPGCSKYHPHKNPQLFKCAAGHQCCLECYQITRDRFNTQREAAIKLQSPCCTKKHPKSKTRIVQVKKDKFVYIYCVECYRIIREKKQPAPILPLCYQCAK